MLRDTLVIYSKSYETKRAQEILNIALIDRSQLSLYVVSAEKLRDLDFRLKHKYKLIIVLAWNIDQSKISKLRCQRSIIFDKGVDGSSQINHHEFIGCLGLTYEHAICDYFKLDLPSSTELIYDDDIQYIMGANVSEVSVFDDINASKERGCLVLQAIDNTLDKIVKRVIIYQFDSLQVLVLEIDKAMYGFEDYEDAILDSFQRRYEEELETFKGVYAVCTNKITNRTIRFSGKEHTFLSQKQPKQIERLHKVLYNAYYSIGCCRHCSGVVDRYGGRVYSDDLDVYNNTIGVWRELKTWEKYLEDKALEKEEKYRETEPVKTEPVKTEPVKTEPVKTEPVKTEPVKTEPVKTEPEEKQKIENREDKPLRIIVSPPSPKEQEWIHL